MVLESGVLLQNRYRIIEILGQGGMGSIYRAMDENLGVEVALKENLFTTEEYAKQFRQEAIILATLRHPNLPRVSDHFVIDGVGQYLIMDYVKGEDLRDLMERNLVIREADILDISIAICDALIYMHSRNPPVLHRDIKPGNVRISPEGTIYLVDFGLAKVVYQGQETSTGAKAMTPGYSPPEQYGAARTDHRTDIYSLAATMYAALTGSIPEDSLARTMDQVELTPIRDRNHQISQRTAKAIEKALQIHPNDRFQTVRDFKNELVSARKSFQPEDSEVHLLEIGKQRKRSQQDLIVSTNGELVHKDHHEQVGGSKLRSFLPNVNIAPRRFLREQFTKKQRRFFLSIGIGLFLVFLVLGISYLVNPAWLSDPDEVSPSAGLQGFEMGEGGSDSLAEESGLLETRTNEFDENKPVEAEVSKLTTTPNEDSLTETRLPFAGDSSTQGDSPTGSSTITPEMLQPDDALLTPLGGGSGQIAFASMRSGLPQVWLVNIDGTNLQQLTDLPTGACQPNWAPDGSRLVFISPCSEDLETYMGAALYIIDADGSNMVSFSIQGLGNFDPAWSPDGNRIAFSALREDERPQIWVRDLRSGGLQLLSESNYRDFQPSWSQMGSKVIFISTRQGPSQVWTMDSDGTNQERFSVSGDLKNSYPVLSPDGQMLIFTQSEGIGSVPRLKGVKFPDGASQEFFLFTQFGNPMREADFSPDGFWVVFEGWPDGVNHDIYLMSINGAELTQITRHSAMDFDPAWRPLLP